MQHGSYGHTPRQASLENLGDRGFLVVHQDEQNQSPLSRLAEGDSVRGNHAASWANGGLQPMKRGGARARESLLLAGLFAAALDLLACGSSSGGQGDANSPAQGVTGSSGGSSTDASPSTGSDASVPIGADASVPTGADAGPSTEAGSDSGATTPGNDADTGPYPDITLAGLTTAPELAPVRLAATGIYPAKVTIMSGGVDNLFGSNPPLVATNAETQALRSSVQHSDLRIIFTVCEGLYRVVGKKSAGINMLADLKGKTVDYAPGTSSAYFLHQTLATVSLSESDVLTGQTPAANSPSAAAAYWETNIQAFAGSIAAGDEIEFQEKDSTGQYVYRELFNLHATAESLADATKRRTIVRFVKALITASAQIRNDPTVVYPLLTGPTNTSQADLAKSLNYERYAGTLVSDALDVLVPEEVWHAKVNNRTARTRAELAPLIDDSIVKEALAL
jgi:NitT/TauT family transport system substrate-binding protein